MCWFFKMNIFQMCHGICLFFVLHTCNFIVSSEKAEALVKAWNGGANINFYRWDKVPEECLETIYCFRDKKEKQLPNGDKLTLFKPGFFNQRLHRYFPMMREAKEIKNIFPGTIIGVDGPVNCQKSSSYLFNGNFFQAASIFREAFSYEREAFSMCAVLNFFYRQGMPLSTIHALCYGSQSVIYTLHALTSNDLRAIRIREMLGIDQYAADSIINNISLCILQDPLLDPYYAVAAAVSSWLPFKRSIQRKDNYFSYSLSRTALEFSYFDSVKNDTMRLLYDIRNSRKYCNTDFAVIWQGRDRQVRPVLPEELRVMSEMGKNFYGCGSNTADHCIPNTSQALLLNHARREAQVVYNPNKTILRYGENVWNNIRPYHEIGNWKGLKQYTERSTAAL